MKIVTWFDDVACSRTTGIYADRALRKMGHEVVHFIRPGSDTPSNVDLYLSIDDSSPLQNPGFFPSAFWCIDTHDIPNYRNLERAVFKSKSFDMVFCAQLDAVRKLKDYGIKNVQWLPLACDPEIHFNLDAYVFSEMIDKVRVEYIGQGNKPTLTPKFLNEKLGIASHGASHLDIGSRYSRAYTVVNESLDNDINMRFFEAMCSGAVLITDVIKNNGVEVVAIEGLHYLSVERGNEQDYIETVDRVCSNSMLFRKISIAGMRHAALYHTYARRMEELLNVCRKEFSIAK